MTSFQSTYIKHKQGLWRICYPVVEIYIPFIPQPHVARAVKPGREQLTYKISNKK